MHRVLHPSRLLKPSRSLTRTPVRFAATQAQQKRAGDISDAFASLSGQAFAPLEPRYADIKAALIAGREEAVVASWRRLLGELKEDVKRIGTLGSRVVPEVDFADVREGKVGEGVLGKYKETGLAVVRGVVSEEEVQGWKDGLREYIRENPQTKAFPANNPQVFELYWSRAQLLARAHPNLLATSHFLMSPWHTLSARTPLSTRHPISYADRLRMRLPGDTSFALGPHVDGGSVERWDPAGYGGREGTYASIFEGKWEQFDPWEAGSRMSVTSDLHQGVGACSMFRMSQGWLALSAAGSGEGSLLVNPLLAKATTYYLLRPFFSAIYPLSAWTGREDSVARPDHEEYLDADNWVLDRKQTSWVQGATPGHGMELSAELHPHLQLATTMVPVPDVRPGDYVSWHCDTIHAVDAVHKGTNDSSVMYIPSCPLTESNAQNLVRQRSAFVSGEPSPDFGGGIGEGEHVGRVQVGEYETLVEAEGRRAMGLEMWDGEEEGLGEGEKEVCWRANKILGFYD